MYAYTGLSKEQMTTKQPVTIQSKRVLLPCYAFEHGRDVNFSGRLDILEQIDKALGPTRHEMNTSVANSLKACAVSGIGGLGKSAIAIEYMHTRKHKFDAVFWINSASTTTLLAGFRKMAVLLGLHDETTVLQEEPEVTRDKVKAWLAGPKKPFRSGVKYEDPMARWLIVFDKADEPDLLWDFWPSGSSGHVLVTSRENAAATTSLPNLTGIALEPMKDADAAQLLLKSSQRDVEVNSKTTSVIIARKLGGLPLAIIQMAMVIRKMYLTLTEFVGYYEHNSMDLLEAQIPGYTKQQTIAFTWDIEDLPPDALALLRVLSMLDGDSVPEEILTNGAQNVGLKDYPTDMISYVEARATLMSCSLISRDREFTVIKMHRLVQKVVRGGLNLEMFRAVFNAAATLQGAVWPFIDNQNLNEIERLRKVQKYQPQVSRLRSVLESRGVKKTRPSLLSANLFNESSWQYSLHETGHGFKVGDEYAVLAQRVAEVNNGQQDSEPVTRVLADSYRHQGIIGSYLGTDKGISCTKKWIELLVERIDRHQLEVDIGALPIAYNEYGRALMRVPDKKEALRSWEMSCDSIREHTKPGQLPFPYPWLHRALILSFDGQANLAESIMLPILEERERKLGKNDTKTFETGQLLTGMGHVMRAQGKSEDSYAYNKRAESVVPAATGENSLASFTAYYRLACDKFERKKFREAKILLGKIINFAGDEQWIQAVIARAQWKLGRTLIQEGGIDNQNEAAILLDKAMRTRRKLAPDDDRKEVDLVDDDWDSSVYYLFR